MKIKTSFLKKLWASCNINARDLCFINDLCFFKLNLVVITHYNNNFSIAVNNENIEKTISLMQEPTVLSLTKLVKSFINNKLNFNSDNEQNQFINRYRLNIFWSLKRLENINFEGTKILSVKKHIFGCKRLPNEIVISESICKLFLKEKEFTRLDPSLYYQLYNYVSSGNGDTPTKILSAKDNLIFRLLCNDFKLNIFKGKNTSIDIDVLVQNFTNSDNTEKNKKTKRAILEAWERLLKNKIIMVEKLQQLSVYFFSNNIAQIFTIFLQRTKEYQNYLKKRQQNKNSFLNKPNFFRRL